MFFCKVTDRKIELDALIAKVDDESFGVQVVFSGIVRNINHGKKVIAVSYDAFVPLAVKSFREICEEANSKFDLPVRTAIVHRIGKLEVGEISIAIVVGSRHRDAAYVASRYIIEQIKVRSPIWKKEHYEDGETEWLKGHALCGHAKNQSGHAQEIHS